MRSGQRTRALRVGLTGGIATGKSAVGGLLAEAGIPVIRADDVGHEILAGDAGVGAALAQRYGGRVMDSGGRPDRLALADVVFRDPLERRFLEGLLHPVIRAECMRRMAEADKAGADLVVIEAALIIEAGWLDAFDRLVVVTCPQSLQLARLQARDGVDQETASRRISAQLPLEEKESLADHLVVNDDSLEVLASRVGTLLSSLRKDTNRAEG